MTPTKPDGPFAALLGFINPMTPPSSVPPCAHERWRQVVREIMEQHPGWGAAEVREAARVRMEGKVE